MDLPDARNIAAITRKHFQCNLCEWIYSPLDLELWSFSLSGFAAVNRRRRDCLIIKLKLFLAQNGFPTSERVISSCVDPGSTGMEGEKTRLSIWRQDSLSKAIWKWPCAPCPRCLAGSPRKIGFQGNLAALLIQTPVYTQLVMKTQLNDTSTLG